MRLPQRFRENVCRIMADQGITRADLARKMDVPPQYVTNYLNGKASAPGLDVVSKFADGLGLEDPADLLLEPAAAAA